MKTMQLIFTALALSAAAAAQAHEFDPGGRIVVTCPATAAPRMADVARAIEESHYWAAQSTRREILQLTREACASSGANSVTFVPPADQRYLGGQERRVATTK